MAEAIARGTLIRSIVRLSGTCLTIEKIAGTRAAAARNISSERLGFTRLATNTAVRPPIRHSGEMVTRNMSLSDGLPLVDLGSPELIDLDRALDALSQMDASLVQTIELRYFLGCTIEETAEILGVSLATVKRDLKFAKTWLYRRIARNRYAIFGRAQMCAIPDAALKQRLLT